MRAERGLTVAEGPKLVAEACALGRAREIYVRAGARIDDVLGGRPGADQAAVYELDAATFDSLASTESPQPVLAVVTLGVAPLGALRELDLGGDGPLLVLAGIADPGNAGAIVRVAEAVGAPAVIATGATADLASPKSYRAAAGAALRVPLVAEGDPLAVIEALAARGVATLGLGAARGVPLDRLAHRRPLALFVGSEAHGLAPELAARLDAHVTIPMAGQVESLNAAVAAAVVAFWVRLAGRNGSDSDAAESE